jgi:hypothetical protein
MYTRLAAALLLGSLSHLARADVVEISPDLFLLTTINAGSSESRLKMDAIREANELAKTRGKVAVPISGRLIPAVGFGRPIYEYQFRIMSREDALAQKPALADIVIATSSSATSADRLYIELLKLDVLRERGLLNAHELQRQKERLLNESPPPDPEPDPVTPPPVVSPAPSGQ